MSAKMWMTYDDSLTHCDDLHLFLRIADEIPTNHGFFHGDQRVDLGVFSEPEGPLSCCFSNLAI